MLHLFEGVSLRYFHIANQDRTDGQLANLSHVKKQNTLAPMDDLLDENSIGHEDGIGTEQVTKKRNNPIENTNTQTPSCLGLRLELTPTKDLGFSQRPHSISLGIASGVAWSPLLGRHLDACDVIISGFEKTNADDYSKLKHNDDCLGYYGTYSLAKAVDPRLLLCCEFSGREGDIRLEVVKKMREELKRDLGQEPSILPGDTGFYLDLESFQIRCSISQTMVDPKKIRVAKSSESFGNLQYLSPNCFI